MPVYEVKSVGDEPRAWTSSHGGNFLSYKVDLESDGHLARGVEWNKKDTSPAPTVGEQVAGILEDGKYGEKFKIDYEATKELGQGSSEAQTGTAGSKNAKGSWQPESERDPERAARILRQHSQGLAVQVLTAMGTFEGKDSSTLHRHLQSWTDFFDQDVNQVGQAANQAQGLAVPQKSKDASPPSSPESGSQPADPSYTEIEQALDGAGLINTPARSKVAEFMITQLAPERVVKAVSNLVNVSDLETQSATLKALKENTERWTGGPLPTETVAGDEPPF